MPDPGSKTGKRSREARAGRGRAGRTAVAAAPVSGAPAKGGSAGAWLLRSLILATPLLVVALFWRFGFSPTQPPLPATNQLRGSAPVAEQRPAEAAGNQALVPDAQIAQMAAQLAARLEREPGDANGWRTLARTYYVMKRFPQAVSAYEKLNALAPLDADVLADYADALAMAQGRRLAGKPMELVRKALEQDPAQWKALSMAATDAFQRNDVGGAIGYWERALAAVPPDSAMAESIRSSLAQARMSGTAPSSAAPAAASSGTAK